jgi:hypothetical protein
MSNDTANRILDEINSLDTTSFTEIARKSIGDPTATLPAKPTARILEANSVGNGTLGFFKVNSTAKTSRGTTKWSAVIKALELNSQRDASGSGGKWNDAGREVEVYRSGFFDNLSHGLNSSMKLAPCYRIDDRPDGTVWLWLADLSEHWPESSYLTAASHIGRFNATYPESEAPYEPWLVRDGASDRRKAPLNPTSWAYPIEQALTEKLVQRAVKSIGTERASQLRNNAFDLFEATKTFPRSIAHNDCHTRNLFSIHGTSNTSQTIAIDWASIGLSPTGVDAGSLIGSGFTWGHDEAASINEFESNTFDAYYESLVQSEWKQPRWQVRLTYLSTVTTYTIQFLMLVNQIAINPESVPAVAMRGRIGHTDPLEIADDENERLTWMIPLIDEALQIAANHP